MTGMPAGWTRRRLRFDCQTNPKKTQVVLQHEDQVSFVPMEAIGTLGDLDASQARALDEVYKGYTYFADGDLCLAKITPCFENGKGAIARDLTNGVGFGTTELHVLRPLAGIECRFLYYMTVAEDFRRVGASEMLGSGGQKRVPEDFIKDWKPPLPDIETQRHICQFLDRKTARIDALIEKKRALLDRLAEKRQAFITQAVTKGLSPDAPMRASGIEWLGDVPAHWECKRLRFLAKLASGSTPTTGEPDYWDGDIPWFSPKDIKADLLTDSIDRVTEFAVSDYGLRVHQNENALIVIRGMILARTVPVAVASGRYTINQDLKAIQSRGQVRARFFRMYLQAIESFLLTLVEESGHGTKKLRTDLLLDLPVLVPPLPEQDSLIDEVERVTTAHADAVRKIEKSVERLLEYRAALITAAVTGQIASLN